MASHTSGNLLADRRFGLAEAMAREGDDRAAADLLEQTLELVPEWAPAWLALGQARERLGDLRSGLDAVTRACRFDPDGHLGAMLQRARLENQAVASMPEAFVRTLFDDYADRFDTHLRDELRYNAPELIAAALPSFGANALGRVLDLGCGTGLMARAIPGRALSIDGVDLSPRMVQQARATGLYRHLAVSEVVAFLKEQEAGGYDTVLAADVFVYLGDLAPVLSQSRRVLKAGGHLCFTVQTGSTPAYALGADMRFHHSPAYIVGTLTEAGLDPIFIEPAATRLDRGQAVPGLLVGARRP